MDEVILKAKPIRLAIFDVDGVLTDGTLIYSGEGIERKEFSVLDGQGIKYLQKSGVEIGIITACKTRAVTRRMQDLEIKHVYQGTRDKIPAFEDLQKKLNLDKEQIAYVGDDFPDLPLIRYVGLGITVPNAPLIIQEHADWVTTAFGGKGAVREVCELIMKAQGTYPTLIDTFLQMTPAALTKREPIQ